VAKPRVRRLARNTVSSLVRTREYLTGREIERLMAAARKGSRWGHRDATMILIGYRHGLRASELCDLRWSQSVGYTSAAPRTARRAFTPCRVMRYGRFGG
jgi:integrase